MQYYRTQRRQHIASIVHTCLGGEGVHCGGEVVPPGDPWTHHDAVGVPHGGGGVHHGGEEAPGADHQTGHNGDGGAPQGDEGVHDGAQGGCHPGHGIHDHAVKVHRRHEGVHGGDQGARLVGVGVHAGAGKGHHGEGVHVGGEVCHAHHTEVCGQGHAEVRACPQGHGVCQTLGGCHCADVGNLSLGRQSCACRYALVHACHADDAQRHDDWHEETHSADGVHDEGVGHGGLGMLCGYAHAALAAGVCDRCGRDGNACHDGSCRCCDMGIWIYHDASRLHRACHQRGLLAEPQQSHACRGEDDQIVHVNGMKEQSAGGCEHVYRCQGDWGGHVDQRSVNAPVAGQICHDDARASDLCDVLAARGCQRLGEELQPPRCPGPAKTSCLRV